MREAIDQANALKDLGLRQFGQGEYKRAIETYNGELVLRQEAQDRDGEASAFNRIGVANRSLGEYYFAASYFEQALQAEREVHDEALTATTLRNLGLLRIRLSQFEEAIKCFEEELPIRQKQMDRSGEAAALTNIGYAYMGLSQYQTAIEYNEKALPLVREAKIEVGEATIVNDLGYAYFQIDKYAKAINFYEQALSIAGRIKNRTIEASALNNLGLTYRILNQGKQALQYYERALDIERKIKSKSQEAKTLNNLGSLSDEQGDYDAALDYAGKALAIAVELRDLEAEIPALNTLGIACEDKGMNKEAIGYFEMDLKIDRETGDLDAEAGVLGNIGYLYGRMGEIRKAIEQYGHSLLIHRETGNRAGAAIELSNLMRAEIQLGLARVAIYHGKQSVITYQSIRGDQGNLPRDLRKSYVASVADSYRNLAELLVGEGRLYEAEQVLLLLKEDEADEFIGKSSGTAQRILALSPHEAEVAKLDSGRIDGLVQLHTHEDALAGKTVRSAEEDSELKLVRQKIEKGTTDYLGFLRTLPKGFSGAVTGGDVAQVDLGKSIASHLSVGTVAVYTLAAEQKYIELLFTSDTALVREISVSDSDLDAKAKALRQKLLTPSSDPKPEAQELYKVMIGPIAKDMESAHADTILWSLDGPLRHLPVAALYDGEHYLIEKYRMAVFSSVRPEVTKPASWNALAFGVSKAHQANGVNFGALPGVPSELRAIVRGDDSPRGAIPGIVKLDDQFTWSAAKGELQRQDHSVVHIASHFEVIRDRMASSFLLLGDGNVLSLSEIQNEKDLFHNVDLLALSACNTATEGDGREVDSLAKIVQDEGAQTVLATLWAVNDPSTSELMGKFYALHESSPEMTKAEALRQAQLALLNGTTPAPKSPRVSESGDFAALAVGGENRSARIAGSDNPIRDVVKQHDYRHPYYWAPFILMGNWK